MIIHKPTLDIAHIEKVYSQKDAVPVKYVCSTEVKKNNVPCDIFYRSTPHPIHGNRYFGIGLSHWGAFIMNADEIEEYVFSMVTDSSGNLHYSRYRHDFVSVDNGNFIDGGRSYVRSSSLYGLRNFKVKNSEFIELLH